MALRSQRAQRWMLVSAFPGKAYRRQDSPWPLDDGAGLDEPPRDGAIVGRLESRGKPLPDLLDLTPFVAFAHGGLIVISEDGRRALDLVMTLLDELEDGDGCELGGFDDDGVASC